MEQNKRKESLNKNENVDGFFEFITDVSTSKIPKSTKNIEEGLRKKARILLETEYSFSPNQILDNPSFEIDNEIFNLDMCVIDEKTKNYLIIIEFNVHEKTSSLTKRRLKQHMTHLNSTYGIIVSENESEFYQRTNEVLIPIANIPNKFQIKEKTQPLTVNKELAKTIADNLTSILKNTGLYEIDAIALSLQILLVKQYDELKHNSTYFSDKHFHSALNTFEILWDKLEKFSEGKFITYNYFKHLSNSTAEKLFSFIREFSISNSDITSLFQSLIEQIPSVNFPITKTPDHLLDGMYEFAPISMQKENHVIVTGVGDSVLRLISFLKSNQRFAREEIGSFLEHGITFSIEDSRIFNILSLFSILSGNFLKLRLEGIIEQKDEELHSFYDSIIIDGLVTKRLNQIENKEFQGLDFHDVLLSQSLKSLKPNGRLIVLLPKTYLFQKRSFRHYLLEECSVRAIIELSVMGTSYNNLNCALVVFEKNLKQKPIFMAQQGSVKRSFFNPYDPIVMDKIFNNFKEFERSGTLSIQDDSGFLVSLEDLSEDWTASRKLPSFKEKISKIKHPVYLENIVSVISGNPLRTDQRRKISYILISDFDDLSEKKKIEKSDFDFPRNLNPKFLTKEGDILLSRAGTIGKTAIITKENENQLVSHGIAILRVKNNEINPLHIKNELEKKFVQDQLENYSQSTYNFYLTTEMIGKVIINLPTVQEQHELGSKINRIESQIKEHREQISKLENELRKIREE